MINFVVIAISAVMLAFVLAWWRWPAFRLRTESPKYLMVSQERRFDSAASRASSGSMLRKAGTV
jgi:hypothetical protein